uniref:THAP-type domain-containing protein n=1 Tax=Sinocyclocheilus anshuiensis TaxID=1608454 RepID=A0A671KKW8_9TELE
MALQSSGTTCAVRGCTCNQTKLNLWLKEQCYIHKPKVRAECTCERRYSFHRLPIEDEAKRNWLKNLNLKKPPKTLYVCSFHFVEKKPTEDNPYPTLFLGYEKPPEKRRRLLRRDDIYTCWLASELDTMDVEQNPTSLCDAQTQWSDPWMEDHTYSKGPTIPCGLTLAPPPELQPAASYTLTNNADCLLYTDQILMTLMKLRQNFVIADLAKRFGKSHGQVSKTVKFWIDVLYKHTKDLIPWLPRETIKATLPEAFKDHFPNTTCIIDCTETVLQKAKNLYSRSESYSHYYASNYLVALVATSPSGLVMFISEAYGGNRYIRYIAQNSGFLDCLRPGDEVMADRGFTIRDLLEERKVNLVMPAFTRKQCQLTNEEVTHTRRIAHARIHIERAIRRLKVYKHRLQTLLINLVPEFDKILQICAAI